MQEMTMKCPPKKNEEGFSLVELIIVIAIAAVLLGFLGVGFGYLANSKVKAASKELYSMFGSAQLATMAKNDALLLIYADIDGTKHAAIVAKNSKDPSAATYQVVDSSSKWSKRIHISYSLQNGSNASISNGQGLVIQFDRATGAVVKTYLMNVPAPNHLADPVSTDWGSVVTDITLSEGTKTYNLNIVPSIGKFYY